MAKKSTKNKNDIDWFKAQEIHKKRTTRAQKVDEAKSAKKTTRQATKSWMKNQALSDVVGIDSKKYKAKNVKEVSLFLQSTFKKVNKTALQNSDFDFRDKKRAIVTIKPRAHKLTTLKNLRMMINLHYNNVSIRSRKVKGRPDDFWITIRKIGK